MKKILVLICLALLGLAPLAGQTTGDPPPPLRLQGTVVDTANAPVPYATIAAYDAKDSLIHGGVTNPEGAYDFTLSRTPATIRIACLGFETLQVPYSSLNPTITLSPETLAIDEVRVEAEKPRIDLRGSSLDMKVQGTTLARETNLVDLLGKIPGLLRRNNTVQTVSGAKPTIFLNGRRVMSFNEIANIDIKTIKSVRYESQPGPKYGSDVEAVIDIRTSSALEGLSLMAKHTSQVNHRYSHDNSLDIKYATPKFSIYGGGSYEDYRQYYWQDLYQTLIATPDTTRLSSQIRTLIRSDKSTGYNVGASYDPSDKVSLGVKYTGTLADPMDRTSSSTKVTLPGGTKDQTDGINETRDRHQSHHVNAYLQASPTPAWSTNLYLDFYYTNQARTQTVEETQLGKTPVDLSFRNGSNYLMYSVYPVVSYRITDRQELEWGGEYTYVGGKGNQLKNEVLQSQYVTQEHTAAGFASYSINLYPVSLKGGLRYEWVSRDLVNPLNPSLNLSAPTSNLFGHLTVSAQAGKTQHSLTFRSSIERPSFSVLNNNSYYLDAYSSARSNPMLRPALSYTGEYKFIWKMLFFSLSYTYTKDELALYLMPDPERPTTSLSGTRNYHHSQQWQGVLGAQYQWGFYAPSLVISTIYSTLHDPVGMAQGIKYTPLVYVDFNNDFELPWELKLNIEYIFQSAATMQFYRVEGMHLLHVRLQRSFFDGALDVAISGKDLLGQDVTRLRGFMPNVLMSQLEYRDQRSVSLDITWRFNKYNDRYKGQSTDVMQRL